MQVVFRRHSGFWNRPAGKVYSPPSFGGIPRKGVLLSRLVIPGKNLAVFIACKTLDLSNQNNNSTQLSKAVDY